MVLEHFLDSEKIKRHAFFIFVLSFLYVLLGFIVSFLFFGNTVSIATMFTLTLLLSPSLAHILGREEIIERSSGLTHFYRNHKDVFKVYFFCFLGLFAGFLVLSWYGDFTSIFQFQTFFLENQRGLTTELLSEFKEGFTGPSMSNVFALFSENLFVVIISFILSIFYGAGAIFLIVLNSSIFVAFINVVYGYASKYGASLQYLLGSTSIYFIPEITGFMLAAIAGGILSTAIYREKLFSDSFHNVLKNCIVLLILAIAVIFISAVLEIYVGQVMLHKILA